VGARPGRVAAAPASIRRRLRCVIEALPVIVLGEH
jgi:hypothetical protein